VAAAAAAALFALTALAPACGASDEEPAKAPAPPAVTVSFPSTVVEPGVENTQCVVLRLGNAEPVHVGAIHNVLGDGSHHMVVYRVNDTEERPEPFPCQPFTDTLDPTKGSPIMVTQKHDDLLTLPEGVAFTLEANQMVRLEVHYINPTPKAEEIHATSTFVPISNDDFRDEADFLFIGNLDVRLAPHATGTLGPTFFELPSEFADAKFFAMTGHEHQYGTNVQVATAASADDPGTMVYDVPGWRWNEPKTEVFETPFTIPESGGFKFTCTWNNTSDKRVSFGESANDEMCFFWAYYYPSQGAQVCFHTKQVGGEAGLDVCCPDHPLCNLIRTELTSGGP
jgi:hypothetical protein